MPQIKSSFIFNSKYPLDSRDSFDTLNDMLENQMRFDEGHITYCKETQKHYIYNENYQDNITGHFKLFTPDPQSGELPEDIISLINNKVDKEEGKGLSTNDFTNEYKSQLDNLPENQSLPEQKINSVLYSNYSNELEWTNKFNPVDKIGFEKNPISQDMFTMGGIMKKSVYQTWAEAETDGFIIAGDTCPIYLLVNEYCIHIIEPLNNQFNNPENPDEIIELPTILILPFPLIDINNPENELYKVYNHELIFTTGENPPQILFGDSAGINLLWEESMPNFEPNKTYKLSFNTHIIYDPETTEMINLDIIGRCIELVGGVTSYGLGQPNINELVNKIKEKREVK